MATVKWIQKVIDNRYQCTGCGIHLTGDGGMTVNVHVSNGHGYCKHCGKMVALILPGGGVQDEQAPHI